MHRRLLSYNQHSSGKFGHDSVLSNNVIINRWLKLQPIYYASHAKQKHLLKHIKSYQASSNLYNSYDRQQHRYNHTSTEQQTHTQSQQSQHNGSKFNKKTIFLGIIGTYIIYGIYELHDEESQHRSWKLAVIKTLPLRLMSRIWGYVNDVELPYFMRKSLYELWIHAFGVKTDDFITNDIASEYKNLSEFFSRTINMNNRTIDKQADLVSPADSRITAFGEIDTDGTIEQIKGMPYTITDLLGFNPLYDETVHKLNYNQISQHDLSQHDIHKSKFYYMVLYLHPGDYHRYHSPTEWLIQHRLHYTGQLMPVAPSFAKWIPKLFARQERVVLHGAWKYGFFSYTPVGAYNVGCMKLDFDKELTTNHGVAWHTYHNNIDAKQYDKTYSPRPTKFNAVEVHRGDEIGYFSLGSTVVLIFEVPEGYKFDFAIGKKAEKAMEESVKHDLAILEPAGIRVRVGQPLGKVVKDE